MNTPDSEIQMDNVGPASEDGFNCIDVEVQGAGSGPVSLGVIHYDSDHITQIQLFIGSQNTSMGNKGANDSTVATQFNTADVDGFIGFHGVISESHILALGFISQDAACSAVVDPDPVDPVDPGTGNGGSSSGNGSGTGTGTDPGTADPNAAKRPEPEKYFKGDDEEDSDDTWYMFLTVCGGIIFILIVVALVVFCCNKSREQRESSKIEMINDGRNDPR